MYLESENFIVSSLKLEDKENIRDLEKSRSWTKVILKFIDALPGGDRFDYFEKL